LQKSLLAFAEILFSETATTHQGLISVISISTLGPGTQNGSWIICHDALSAWWEKEAQDYLASCGFKDRQWRAWGKVNKGTRYHRRLVGNRPELMPLDAHLNSDLKHEARKLVISTSGHLDEGDERRFGYGTPDALSKTLIHAWQHKVTSSRIVEDIERIPRALDAIIEAKGGLVPDCKLRSGRRKSRAKRTREPEQRTEEEVAVAELLRTHLREKVENAASVRDE